MTLTELRTLLDFHYWARDRVLEAVEALTPEQFTRDLGSSFGSVRDTLGHLLAAEWVWHQRWVGAAPTALPPADRFAHLQVTTMLRQLGASPSKSMDLIAFYRERSRA